ncbi:hypothetical protein D9M71_753650 [compost metagenome]
MKNIKAVPEYVMADSLINEQASIACPEHFTLSQKAEVLFILFKTFMVYKYIGAVNMPICASIDPAYDSPTPDSASR